MIPHRDATEPKAIAEQILAIAPIVPGQRSHPKNNTPVQNHYTGNDTQAQPPAIQKLAGNGNLIDFGGDSRSSTPTNNIPQQQKPRAQQATGLMDDDSHVDMMNQKMKDMNMHEPMTAATGGYQGDRPLQRTDTETSDVDVFVDAET